MAIEKPVRLATNCLMRSDEGSIEEQLAALEAGALDLAAFPHREHVRLGFEMLARYSFGEAVERFSRGLNLLVAKIGKPEVYHETVTVAFLAVIGECRARDQHAEWNEFIAANAELLEKRCLEKWYDPEQLTSDLARRVFCLPKRARSENS